MIAAVLLFVFLAALSAYFYLKKDANKKVEVKPPGPLALPVIGASYLMDNNCCPFIKFSELADKYGDIYSLRLGSTDCIVVSSVPRIKTVLMQNGKFFAGRPDFVRYNVLFGGDRKHSLALCDWDDLQAKRRNISRKHCDPRKFSHLNKIISDVGTMELKEFVDTVKTKSAEASLKGEDLELKPILMATCLNIFSQYMCSIRFDNDDTEFLNITRLFDEIFWEINQGYAVDFMPWMKPLYKSHMNKLADWSQTIRNFILKRIINNRETDLDEDEPEKDFTDALLKILKSEEKEGSEKESGRWTRDAILFTLEDFLGGSSAVGNTIMVTLAELARHPEVAEKIRDEVYELTEGTRLPSVEDSDNLPYTIAAVKEILRYRSSPIVPHVAMEDAKVDGYDVKKGTVIIINNYKINMDETLWNEPAKYEPERFVNRTYVEISQDRRPSGHDSGVEFENEETEENKIKNMKRRSGKTRTIISEENTIKKEIVTLKQNLNHFMPFSIGKRSCLGQGLLMKYSMAAIATICQNFDISCRKPETIHTYPACIALPPDTFSLTLTPIVD